MAVLLSDCSLSFDDSCLDWLAGVSLNIGSQLIASDDVEFTTLLDFEVGFRRFAADDANILEVGN